MARGNPNWGKPKAAGSVIPPMTEFERTVAEFNLNPNEYLGSSSLREWAVQNRNSRYVPEYLLKAWKLEVCCPL